MKFTTALIIFIILALGAGFFYFKSAKQPLQPQTQQPQTTQPFKENSPSSQTIPGYSGKVLAGTKAPFLEFNKGDYEKALSEGKIIVLDFYANWCPICRAEEPDLHAGFDGLTTNQVIGFRVNFNDSETDSDEESLAKEFKIPYQHTKVILKNGKEFSRSTDSWTKETFDTEIAKTLQ